FARVLRSVLRHDPDVILVGEIRDTETARIAVQAALTGHLVLSTLHTNSAAGSITRLIDMGVEGYLIASTVRAVLAQRLVRRLCAACRQPYTPAAGLLEELALAPRHADAQLFRPRGCEACGGTGYRGRLAIGELLPLDESIQKLV